MEIKLNRVSKNYNQKSILSDFSFSLKKGEKVCVMGESGRGKTTLFRIIMGLERIDRGECTTNNAKFSTVFQEDRLFERYSAFTNIKMACEKSIPDELIYTHLEKLLPNANCSAPLSSFSGGMKRRVAIVRSIVAESDFVIMDEPLTGLDKEARDLTMSYILNNLGGRGFLYSTHHFEEYEVLGGKRIEIV